MFNYKYPNMNNKNVCYIQNRRFFPKLDQSSANTHTHTYTLIITHSQGDADIISMTVDSQ